LPPVRRNRPPPQGWSPSQTSRYSLWSGPWRHLLCQPFGRGASLRSPGSVDFILPTTQPFCDGCCYCRYIHGTRSQVAKRTAPPAAWSYGQSVQLDVGASSMLGRFLSFLMWFMLRWFSLYMFPVCACYVFNQMLISNIVSTDLEN
jgi:hypothetical protein